MKVKDVSKEWDRYPSQRVLEVEVDNWVDLTLLMNWIRRNEVRVELYGCAGLIAGGEVDEITFHLCMDEEMAMAMMLVLSEGAQHWGGHKYQRRRIHSTAQNKGERLLLL